MEWEYVVLFDPKAEDPEDPWVVVNPRHDVLRWPRSWGLIAEHAIQEQDRILPKKLTFIMEGVIRHRTMYFFAVCEKGELTSLEIRNYNCEPYYTYIFMLHFRLEEIWD